MLRVFFSLIGDSHAYEITQVREREWERDAHGPNFGSMLRAVDTKMQYWTGLSAVHPNEHYQAYAC